MVAMILPIIFILSIMKDGNITGHVVSAGEGCCEDYCQQSSESECSGNFHYATTCDQVEACNVGCCIDGEGYCFGNFLKSQCEEKQGEFVFNMECNQYWKCLQQPKNNSPRGFTGYPFYYAPDQKGTISIDPISAKAGSTITINANVFEKDEVNSVEARIFLNAYSSSISLYDDGFHGDKLDNDGIFGNSWDSSDFPMAEEFEKVNLSVIIDGGEYPGEIILSKKDCVPLIGYDNEANKGNVVFIDFANESQKALYDSQVNNALGMFVGINYTEALELQYFKVSEFLSTGDISEAPHKVSEECTFYNSNRDLLIFFNNDKTDCEQNYGFIETTPEITLRKNIGNIKLNEFIQHFCNYVQTKQQLLSKYDYAPPEVSIGDPLNNSVFNVPQFDLSFGAKDDLSGSVKYGVYIDSIDDEFAANQGTIDKDATEILTIGNLSDGEHYIFIEAEDDAENYGYAELIINVEISNFNINITSLNEYCLQSPIDINYSITHNSDSEINYSILIDGISELNSMTATSTVNNFQSNLIDGEHTVKLTAYDSTGRTINSIPYLIYLGNDCTLE